MTARKLSESDKQQILELYRLPGETTSTLATRFGVSNSTVSRILKINLSEEEYEALIQQKRSARFSNETPSEAIVEDVAEDTPADVPEVIAQVLVAPVEVLPIEKPIEQDVETQLEMPLLPDRPAAPILRRSRKHLASEAEESAAAELALPEVPEARRVLPNPEPLGLGAAAAPLGQGFADNTDVLKELLHEELLDGRVEDLEEDDLDEDEDDLDDLEDEFDEGDEDLEAGVPLLGGRTGRLQVQVLPIADAPIPKTCYLVVDRSSELIARPLKEFGDLGQIPEAETLEKTLPVFDNHRVAKRFSNPRTQRVIKLPDGKVLQKTSSHLSAKGITRLLIDGQVYAL